MSAAVLASFAQSPALDLRYKVEWRLFDAGVGKLEFNGQNVARVQLESTGVVGRFYRVNDKYMAVLDSGLCTSTVSMQAEEGDRRRETLITFDKQNKRASYLEKDLAKNKVILQKDMDLPGCVHDVIGALLRLRSVKLEPGQSVNMPVSDGKKIVSARVDCEGKETVKTPAGSFPAIRYQAHLFDGVLYNRKGSLYVWISDDERRLPVQIQARLRFYIGTITAQLTSPAAPAAAAPAPKTDAQK